MRKLNEVYKCDKCGILVEVIHGGAGTLVCCGVPMLLMEENTVDAAKEKHVPVLEKIADGWRVKVGDVEHPMLDKHYIEWIELLTDTCVYRQQLTPGMKPEAVFHVNADPVSAREYCNLHGVWKG